MTSPIQTMVLYPVAAPLPAYQESTEYSGPEEITTLAAAVSPEDFAFTPPLPQNIAQTGISDGSIEDLILKTLYSRGETIGRELAAALGLKFSLIEPRVEFKNQRHSGQARWDLAAFRQSSDCRRRVVRGPGMSGAEPIRWSVPVPIDQYVTAVRAQRLKRGWLTLDALEQL